MTLTAFRDEIVSFLGSVFGDDVDSIEGGWDVRENLSNLQTGKVSLMVVCHRATPRLASRTTGVRGSGGHAPAKKTRQYEAQIGMRVKVADKKQGPDPFSDLMEEIGLTLQGEQFGGMAVDTVASDPLYDPKELRSSGVFVSVLLVTAIGGE